MLKIHQNTNFLLAITCLSFLLSGSSCDTPSYEVNFQVEGGCDNYTSNYPIEVVTNGSVVIKDSYDVDPIELMPNDPYKRSFMKRYRSTDLNCTNEVSAFFPDPNSANPSIYKVWGNGATLVYAGCEFTFHTSLCNVANDTYTVATIRNH